MLDSARSQRKESQGLGPIEGRGLDDKRRHRWRVAGRWWSLDDLVVLGCGKERLPPSGPQTRSCFRQRSPKFEVAQVELLSSPLTTSVTLGN